ncbi:MAG: hypothetical protein HY854_23445 [Burkholderiales bacterium]|nr:hypothetical protein [Burkholderiales bacterium]
MPDAKVPRSARIDGKSYRFEWGSGPTAGQTHEHVFHPDGSVSYGEVKDGQAGEMATEKQYAAFDVGPDVVLVSYLGSSGYTLTVAMNFSDHRLHGVASGDGQWFPVAGTFSSR